MGNRILSIAVHALIESQFNYDLTVTGAATPVEGFESMEKKILNPAARRIAVLGYSVRREIIYALADIRSAHRHFLLKVASVLDRILRACHTQAKKRMLTYMQHIALGHELRKPGRAIEQIAGPIWSRRQQPGEQREPCWHRNRWRKTLHHKEISWRQQKLDPW